MKRTELRSFYSSVRDCGSSPPDGWRNFLESLSSTSWEVNSKEACAAVSISLQLLGYHLDTGTEAVSQRILVPCFSPDCWTFYGQYVFGV